MVLIQSIGRKIIILFFLLQFQVSFAQSGKLVFPRLEPDQKAIDFSIPGREHSWTDYARICLWASGDLQSSNLQKIINAVEKLQADPQIPKAEKEKAEYILTYMHKNILKSYSLYQTRVDTLLANGRYNCVSSAVLYMILCTAQNIQTSGVMTKDHAFVMVHTGGADIDVETTNRYGFDPGTRKEFNDQFGQLTGFAYVPERNYRDRQRINRMELVSLILSNRIAELEKSKKYADAVPVAIDRAAMLGKTKNTKSVQDDAIFTDPYKDILDRLLNYGSQLLTTGKEEDCLRWIETASLAYPDDKHWQELTAAAANNFIMKLTKAGKFPEARTFLEKQKNLLDKNEYSQLDIMLYDNELGNRINKIRSAAEGKEAIEEIESAFKNGKISDKRRDEMLPAAISKTAEFLSAAPEKNWRAAAVFLEDAIKHYGNNRIIEKNLQIYWDNVGIDIHNAFANAVKRRDLDEAERIINEGLIEFPKNKQLLADRDLLEKNKRE